MASQAFRRMKTVRVPVSLTSAATVFDLTLAANKLPDIPDLTFQFWNPNPFDCGLEGTPMNGLVMPTNLVAVTASSGYPVAARTKDGVYGSKRPVWLSAAAYPTPEQLEYMGANFDWTGRFLWLIYGQGR